jgi:hypothetical protein
MNEINDLTPLGHAITIARRQLEQLQADCAELEYRINQVFDDRRRIAAILKTFRESPVSASSLQPVLQLADELNGPMR